MKFPKRVKHRGRVYATIYNKSASYGMYRVVWLADGKRKVQAFQRFSGKEGANQFAETKARELSHGSSAASLTSKQASDALAAFKVLERFNSSTGKRLSLHELACEFSDSSLRLSGYSIREAVDGFFRNTISVQRKAIAEALDEFTAADEPRTKSKEGERAQLSSEYFRIRHNMLTRFAGTFPGYAVCDLTKAHLDTFFTSLSHVSPKYRNHYRVSIRQFFAWCVRKDYLSTGHRLNEADGIRQEVANTADVQFYTAKEFRALLKTAEGRMRPLIAIGGLAGLRTAELLRLDWSEVWRIGDHIEVTKDKGKKKRNGRSRRLVDVCASLSSWLDPYRHIKEGLIWTETESVFQKRFSALCEAAGVRRNENGLRHSFCTYHFALHANENMTSMQAGNTPQVMHNDYKGLATKAEAEAWFAVAPMKAENLISLPVAAQNA